MREHAYCLSLAAAQVGSAQIRNAAPSAATWPTPRHAPTGHGADRAGRRRDDGRRRRATRTRPIGEVVLGPSRTSLAHERPSPGSRSRRSAPSTARPSARSGRGPRSASPGSAARWSCASTRPRDARVRPGRPRRGRRSRLPRRRAGARARGPAGGRGDRAAVRGGLCGGRAGVHPRPLLAAVQAARCGGPGLRRLEHAGVERALRARLGVGPPRAASAAALRRRRRLALACSTRSSSGGMWHL